MAATTDWDEAERQSFEEGLRERLRQISAGHPWIVAGAIAQSSVAFAGHLTRAGAERVLAVGAHRGVGDIDEKVDHIVVGDAITGFGMTTIRDADRALRDPPAALLEAVDRFDPDGSARSIVDVTMAAGTMSGRPTFGARPRSWEALEDKIGVAELWNTAGIRSAPMECVELDPADAVLAAHRRLASPEGTVWSVDAAAGWHGGAHGTHWVPNERVAARVVDGLDPRHRRVRVMPFLAGPPCSIHGMVLETTTIAFRPIETLTYLDRPHARLVYCRASSHWDPPPDDRDEMRSVAVAVGEALRARVGFRGVFTVDGVLTTEGFRPTEVNPRFGAALPMAMATLAGEPLNLYLVHLAVVEGLIDPDAPALERWVSDNMDATRFCSAFFETAEPPAGERLATIRTGADGRVELVDGGDGGGDEAGDAVATIEWAGTGSFGMLRVTGGPGMPIGPLSAPVVLEAARVADTAWRMGLPTLESPAEITPSRAP